MSQLKSLILTNKSLQSANWFAPPGQFSNYISNIMIMMSRETTTICIKDKEGYQHSRC